jgi:hypothetical protein
MANLDDASIMCPDEIYDDSGSDVGPNTSRALRIETPQLIYDTSTDDEATVVPSDGDQYLATPVPSDGDPSAARVAQRTRRRENVEKKRRGEIVPRGRPVQQFGPIDRNARRRALVVEKKDLAESAQKATSEGANPDQVADLLELAQSMCCGESLVFCCGVSLEVVTHRCHTSPHLQVPLMGAANTRWHWVPLEVGSVATIWRW